VIERIQQVMASGQIKAVERLSELADKLMASGDVQNLQVVIDALTDIATGRKTEKEGDKLLAMLMEDRKEDKKLLNQIMLNGNSKKDTDSNQVMMQTMEMMGKMFGFAKELAPQGEDVNVSMVREIGNVVQNSMKEVTDTVKDVTGSGHLGQEKAQAPAQNVSYKCSKCQTPVQSNWRNCPVCGLIFSGAAVPTNVQVGRTKAPAVETFQAPAAPPIPKELQGKLGYLRNLAKFIRDGHDPATKGSALFKMCGPEEKVGLLFTAEFGYTNLMRLANPYRNSPDIPDGPTVFKIVESEEGKQWLIAFFQAIKNAAKEENVTLTDGDREHFIDELNKHSPVSFKFKPRKVQEAPPAKSEKSTRVIEPPEWKERRIKPEERMEPDNPEEIPNLDVEIPTPIRGPDGKPVIAKIPMSSSGPKAAMTTCPICNNMVLSSELKNHLFTNHPKKSAPRPSFHEVGSDGLDGADVQMNEAEEPEGEHLT
jgi:rubrerythrin